MRIRGPPCQGGCLGISGLHKGTTMTIKAVVTEQERERERLCLLASQVAQVAL